MDIGTIALLLVLFVILAALLLFVSRKSGAQPQKTAVQLDSESIRGVAGSLARSHKAEPGRDRSSQAMLAAAAADIRKARAALAAVPEDENLAPAGRWLLDNIYMIEQEIFRVKNMLRNGPTSLPIIKSEGCPRVCWISDNLLSYTNGRLDTDTLALYLNEYQKKTPLTLKELWILPAFLRLSVLRRVAEVSAACSDNQAQWEAAEAMAEFIATTPGDEAAWLARSRKNPWMRRDGMGGAFLERLSVRLMEQGEGAAQPLKWLDQILSERGFILEDQIASSHHRQGAEKQLIGNCMDSLRYLDALNWLDLFRQVSVVERTLMEDPSGVYKRMDEPSRGLYRRRVEALAARWHVSELHLTRLAVQCAAERAGSTYDKETHIGYYIVGDGLGFLAGKLKGRRFHLDNRFKQWLYGGSIWLSAAALAAALGYLLPATVAIRVLVGLAALPVFTKATVFLVNETVKRAVRSEVIPAIDLKDGVPDEGRTLVVIPALVTSAARIEALMAQLETLYLRHGGKNLRYALLADFKDSREPDPDGDAALLAAGQAAAAALCARWGEDLFHFLARDRRFNDAEGVYMGPERKRGAILALNRLLLNGDAGEFTGLEQRPACLDGVRFVLTLDADTELPHEAAARLIGMMLHPLNIAEIDNGVVRRGYGILQPRVELATGSSRQSEFSAIFTGPCGLDHYSGAVADSYQDLFGEGIFTGKGIYDVRAFMATLEGSLPANRILSHDLLEGSYARAGFASDVAVVDGFPSNVYTYFVRMHRWVRGDWQIAHWLCRTTPESKPNPINGLSKYKIADNLRRSLMAPAQLVLILLCAVAGRVWLGMAAVLAVEFLPALFALAGAMNARGNGSLKLTLAAMRSDFLRPLMNLWFLPFEAWIMVDAAVRSLYRMAVSKKRLLLWTTAADAERGKPSSPGGYWAFMWPAVAISVVAMGITFVCAPTPAALLWVLAPLAWAAAPQAAWALSRPNCEACSAVDAGQERLVRAVCRRTWHYFERFVTAEEHFLAPDNFQEYPFKGVAPRTSPTNIGLSLLANADALDLGYLTPRRMIDRMSATIDAVLALPKWQGHLYNWYDTRTCEPLHPLYVSSVDSGNLMAYLLLCAQAVREVAAGPAVSFAVVGGLVDTLRVMAEKKPDAAIEQMCTALEMARDQHSMRLVAETAEKAAALADRLGGKWAAQAADLVDDVIEESEDLLEALSLLGAEQRVMLEGDWENYARPEAWAPGGRAAQAVEVALKGAPNERLEELRASIGAMFEQRTAAAAIVTEKLERCAMDMNLNALYDKSRDLFHIGCNVEQGGRLGNSFYDLLASEARLTSLLAIAYGKVPARHWKKLGRALTLAGGGVPLLSWGGTMFEYLMPALTLRHRPCTLLGETIRAAIQAQIDYGALKGIPWGISESGYHEFDLNLNYQYRSFGVPDMGMKAGLSHDMVVSPYSTLMAMQFKPEPACENLKRLCDIGMLGEYGMYEAVDFTPERRQEKDGFRIVKSYMIHHQGMALTALANLLCGSSMVERFHRLAPIRSVELLMEERAPSHGAVLEKFAAAETTPRQRKPREVRMVRTVHGTEGLWPPQVHLLSNGSYVVHVAASGAGCSRWDGLSLNRWHDDAVAQDSGVFFYLRDTETAEVWNTTLTPGYRKPEEYEVVFETHTAQFRRRDGDVTTLMEVVVSPDSPAEVRRLCLSNKSEKEKHIEVTAYFEVALATQEAFGAHPAFQNLFVQTEALGDSGVVLVRRRPRDSHQGTPHMACRFVGEQGPIAPVQVDTSREASLGRGRSLLRPKHLEGGALGNTQGNVLDPAVCMRTLLTVPAGGTVTLSFVIACGWDRPKALAASDALAAPGAVERAFEMAWTQEQANMRYLGVKPNQLRLFADMSTYVLYSLPGVRSRLGALDSVRRGQSALWELGLSGDVPIIVLKLSDLEHLEAARHLLLAHAWWRFKGVSVDIVFVNEYGNDYRRPLHDRLHDTILSSHERDYVNKKGGVHVLTASSVHADTMTTLLAVARCILQAGQPLTAQLRPIAAQASLAPSARPKPERWEEAPLPEIDTVFHNGLGGFTEDGSEYVITLEEGTNTPLPWCNVISNGSFGMVATDMGPGYTWQANSRENKLTPWHNDPVTGSAGEGLYLRDRESGDFWTVSPGPARGPGLYRVRHGQGWTCYEYGGYGLTQENLVFLPVEGDVRVQLLKIVNPGPRVRELDVTWYADFVMGAGRENTAPYLSVRRDPQSGALWAENGYRDEFAGQLLYMAAPGKDISFTANRCEFAGVLGGLANPAGMVREEFSGSLGPGLGGCAALRLRLRIPPGMSRQVVLLMGTAANVDDMRGAIRRFATAEAARSAFKEVCRWWKNRLGVVKVKTPDNAMDILLNRWLLYQTCSSRVLGRAGFYQAGGAIGFRDQLQDMLALIWSDPDRVREHILLCAEHQFESGDVQHWWHPPYRGVRTRMTDDMVFLPFLVADYIEHTGDTGILREECPYLKDVEIAEGAEDYYGVAEPSDLREPLFLHCLRALHRAARAGEHGLPLMGTGDWNDAMSSVGDEGRGESVWLAFFLSFVQRRFAEVLLQEGMREDATELQESAAAFEHAVEEAGWDGAWYRRAFFDDGTPLGSALNDECRIDCISQSWAAINGRMEPSRVESAMQALEKNLVSFEDGIVRLLWPPFANTALEPGYIKGYLPGVRENGGQYTHGAIWAVWAYAQMGLGDMAWRLLYLLNPIQHSGTPMGKDRYKAEPYVLAADVYSVPPLVGRGGWTWYTGSSAWMYRVAIEYLLGLYVRGDKLLIQPCIPAIWREYNMEYRHGKTLYIIHVENARGVCRGVRQVIVDGRAQADKAVHLSADGETHSVHVLMGSESG